MCKFSLFLQIGDKALLLASQELRREINDLNQINNAHDYRHDANHIQLKKLDEERQFSFHVPPWNSIDHLHVSALSWLQYLSEVVNL